MANKPGSQKETARRWPELSRHVSQSRKYLSEDLWERPKEEFEGWYARGHAVVQYLGITGRKFLRDECQLRASALTYVTLIAIVPVLAVALAVVKGLYLDDAKVKELMGQLQGFLPQIKEGFAQEALGRIQEYVQNVDAGKLGAIGAVALFVTVVTTLGSIEKSFNRIWNVKKGRSILRRTADYIAVVVLAAVLLIPASAMNAASQSLKAARSAAEAAAEQGTPAAPAEGASAQSPPEGEEPAPAPETGTVSTEGEALSPETGVVPTESEAVSSATGAVSTESGDAEAGILDKTVATLSGTFWRVFFRVMPLVFMFMLFSFLYFFFPNTRVRPTSAALGAFTATILWQLAQYAYFAFQVGVAKANAIYGALASLPILLAWVYLSWMIVLIGAEIASVHHLGLHIFILPKGREVPFSTRERVGLDLLVRISRAFRNGDRPPSGQDLARSMRIHEVLTGDLLDILTRLGFLHEVETEGHGFVPGRELHDIKVYDVVRGLRNASARHYRSEVHTTEEVSRTAAALEQGAHEAVAGMTIADLLEGKVSVPGTAENRETGAPTRASVS